MAFFSFTLNPPPPAFLGLIPFKGTIGVSKYSYTFLRLGSAVKGLRRFVLLNIVTLNLTHCDILSALLCVTGHSDKVKLSPQ